jgi:uncharacterized membrane protein YfcA
VALEYLVVPLVALLASGLTLFSGFGLGTLLMPAVAIFFPLPLAIAMTALVHLANNVFKTGLLGRYADLAVLWRFGMPAILAAFAGAWLLAQLAASEPIARYALLGREYAVMPVKLVIGLLILAFVGIEASTRVKSMALDRRWLPLGGVVSGFFGGLSGHQGALRSLFLVKAGLPKEAFVATGAVIAMMIDLTRLGVYGHDLRAQWQAVDWWLLGLASLAAFLGAYLGSRLLHKVTIAFVQRMVAGLLVVVGLGLIAGVL